MSQVQRLMRRLENQAAAGAGMQRAYLGREPGLSREDLQSMQDERRNRLAERLLEVGLEECAIDSFTDTHAEVEQEKYTDQRAKITLKEWYVKHAEAALAAAEVIYPEVPETREPGSFASVQLPPAAQEGARSVLERGGEAGRRLADEAVQLGRDLAAHGLEG